ncbi:MAG: TOBE domain-containing protein [Candidatus Acidiferrales bacterium]
MGLGPVPRCPRGGSCWPREAAQILGISFSTLKQWIYSKKLRAVKTAGGHHRIPRAEIDRYLHCAGERPGPERRRNFRQISGRNQLVGRVVDVKVEGLMAQVKLSIGGQQITSIITAEAARELNLKRGDTAAALIKSTEVMIVRV